MLSQKGEFNLLNILPTAQEKFELKKQELSRQESQISLWCFRKLLWLRRRRLFGRIPKSPLTNLLSETMWRRLSRASPNSQNILIVHCNSGRTRKMKRIEFIASVQWNFDAVKSDINLRAFHILLFERAESVAETASTRTLKINGGEM